MAGISGVSITGPTSAVRVNADGQLGTATSSSRELKRDIRAVDARGSAGVLALDPVSYRYRGQRSGRRQFGLIAEQVAERLPALAQYDDDGKAQGVYYDQLSVLPPARSSASSASSTGCSKSALSQGPAPIRERRDLRLARKAGRSRRYSAGMSREVVDALRASFDQFARGDFSAYAQLPDEFELVTAPEMPDAGTYRGRGGPTLAGCLGGLLRATDPGGRRVHRRR